MIPDVTMGWILYTPQITQRRIVPANHPGTYTKAGKLQLRDECEARGVLECTQFPQTTQWHFFLGARTV